MPAWNNPDCPSGERGFDDGAYRRTGDNVPTEVNIVEVVHADLDVTPPQTAALLQCMFFESVERMVVGFDRDARDRIVTMGPVVRSGDSDIG